MTERDFYNHPDRLDSPARPHWSVSCEWRPGRWDPMSNAPASTREIRGRDARGNLLEPMHFACAMSGEDLPSFCGWFMPNTSGRGFHQVSPVEWQPVTASPSSVRMPAPRCVTNGCQNRPGPECREGQCALGVQKGGA